MHLTRRTLVATVAFLVAALAPLAAQQASSATALSGAWTGTYVTDGPSGTMSLTVSRDGTAWKVENVMGGDGAPPGSAVRDFKVEGNVATWVQTFGPYEVNFKATLDGATLKGTLEAFEAGALVGSGTFTLTKS